MSLSPAPPPPRLVTLQQVQSTFFKDEGGKSNTLVFRVRLEGDIDISLGGPKGEVPFTVEAVFEDGTLVPKQKDVLDVLGCTEKPNGEPSLCLTSKVGGVFYRLKQVSKRLDDRRVCVRLTLPDNVPVPPITSVGTIVHSKRKNKEQRELQQQQEKQEMDRREEEAVQQLLQAKRSRMDNGGGGDADWGHMQEEVSVLKQRIVQLEKIVRDQQDMISLFLPAPPNLGRSISQATWGINGVANTVLTPPPSHHAVVHQVVNSPTPGATAIVSSPPASADFGIPPDLRREHSNVGGGEYFPSQMALRRLATTDYAPPMLRRETSMDSNLGDLSQFEDAATT